MVLVKDTDQKRLNSLEHTEIILEKDLLLLTSQNKSIHWEHYLSREYGPGG